MKAIHIIEKLDLHGGTPTKLLGMLEHSSLDHTFATFSETSEETKSIFNSAGGKVVDIKPRLLFSQIAFILRILSKNQCNVVNTHFFRAYLTGLTLKIIRPKTIWIHHEHSSSRYLSKIRRIIICLSSAVPDAVTANSEHVKADVARNLGYGENKISVVYPGVSLRKKGNSSINRTSLGISKSDSLILHIGGMISLRDQKTIILAFCEFLKQKQNSTLVFVGDGPERKSLENLAQQLGITKKILFLSYLENPIDLLRESDVYINSTLDEGFGIAVIEAQLAEIPVILSLAGAHMETGIEGGAVFYSPKSHDSLLHAMKFVDENIGSIRKLMTSVRLRAEQKFSPSNFSKQLDTIIRNLSKK